MNGIELLRYLKEPIISVILLNDAKGERSPKTVAVSSINKSSVKQQREDIVLKLL